MYAVLAKLFDKLSSEKLPNIEFTVLIPEI